MAEVAVETLRPVGGAMRRLISDPAEMDHVLAAGAEKAAVIAEATVKEVRKPLGLWPGRPEG